MRKPSHKEQKAHDFSLRCNSLPLHFTMAADESKGGDNGNIVALQIPDGAGAGDILTFVVNGQSLELPVPPGSQPGDVLEIQLGGDNSNHDDGGNASEKDESAHDNISGNGTISQSEDTKKVDSQSGNDDDTKIISSDTVSIPLVSVQDQVLKLATTLPTDTIKSEENDDNTKSDNSGSDGTNAMVWPAGLEMVRYLQTSQAKETLQKLLFVGKSNGNGTSSNNGSYKILELGSGLGIVGMTLAIEILGNYIEKEESSTTTDTATTTTVVLTDTDRAIPLLQHNVDQNTHVLPSNVKVTTQPLVWGTNRNSNNNNTSKEEKDNPHPPIQSYDWIIGSDLLYNLQSIPDLVQTIQQNINSNHGRILIAVRWRKPTKERQFFELLSSLSNRGGGDIKIEWTCLSSPKGCCPHALGWQNYGNPNSKDWIQYSNTTMVAVKGGHPKSINHITEQDLNQMTDEESKAWENAQIQIYLGTVLNTKNTIADDEKVEKETKRPRLDR